MIRKYFSNQLTTTMCYSKVVGDVPFCRHFNIYFFVSHLPPNHIIFILLSLFVEHIYHRRINFKIFANIYLLLVINIVHVN